MYARFKLDFQRLILHMTYAKLPFRNCQMKCISTYLFVSNGLAIKEEYQSMNIIDILSKLNSYGRNEVIFEKKGRTDL